MMIPRTKVAGRARLVVLMAGLALVGAAGCAAAKPAGGTVAVVLQEWAVVPDSASVKAGPVTFNVSNKGPDDAHELVIIKTDLAPGTLPTDELGKVDEEGAGLETIGEVEEFDPGKVETATFDLKAGTYALICNIVQDEPDGSKESHYRQGMFIAFTVN